MDQPQAAPVIDRSEVIERHFQITEQLAIIEGRHKAELEPLKEELKLCDQFVKESMNSANEQQVKTLGGDTCFFVTKKSATVDDMNLVIDSVLEAAPPPADLGIADPDLWKRVLGHIKTNGMWTMLNNAVNKTTVVDMIKQTGVIPTGVKYSEFKDLSWKRGKGTGAAA